jgi:hypothetical protein
MSSTGLNITAAQGAGAEPSKNSSSPDENTKQQVVESADDLQLVSRNLRKAPHI